MSLSPTRLSGRQLPCRRAGQLRRQHLRPTAPAGVTHPDDETSLIAPTFQDMLGTLRALIDAAVSWGSTVNMDKLIKSVGGQTALDKVNMDSSTKGSPAFRNRYLFTSRCGLIDMLHFLEMLYIAHFLEGQSVDPNRAATRMGREHNSRPSMARPRNRASGPTTRPATRWVPSPPAALLRSRRPTTCSTRSRTRSSAAIPSASRA